MKRGARRPGGSYGLTALGFVLTALGAAAIAGATALVDPAAAGPTLRKLVTAAFGLSQFGLALVAVSASLRLYRHAARITGNSRLRRRRQGCPTTAPTLPSGRDRF